MLHRLLKYSQNGALFIKNILIMISFKNEPTTWDNQFLHTALSPKSLYMYVPSMKISIDHWELSTQKEEAR